MRMCGREQVQNVLCSLIQFVTDNPGRDPLNLEGTPVRSRQRFLREQGIIEVLVELLQQSFVDGHFMVRRMSWFSWCCAQ
jgi:hypothetical protein